MDVPQLHAKTTRTTQAPQAMPRLLWMETMTENTRHTGEQWMRALRAANRLLVQRGSCGKWTPLLPRFCALPAGHRTPCGRL